MVNQDPNDFEFSIWNNPVRLYKTANTPRHVERLERSSDPTVYILNSFGYRSPEFFSNPKLIAAGCSMTFGEGVPEDRAWGRVLSNSLNFSSSYVNLGIRGGSIGQTVLNVFAYIKKYGTPEYLFCLFPNQERMEFVFHKDFILDEYGKDRGSFSTDCDLSHTHLHHKNFTPPAYLKSPVNLQDVIPIEYAVYLNMGYIDMLTTYCDAANIKFRWSTWDHNFDEHAKKYLYKGYVSILDDFNKQHVRTEYKCHEDLYLQYKENFHNGLDKSPHWGIHRHAHMAELFLKSLI